MENFLAEDLFDVFDESDQKAVNDRLFTNFKRENDQMQDEHNVKKLKTEAILEDINFDEIRSRIIVHGIQTIESCTHEVAIPPDQEYTPLETLITKKPAKEYKFVLDPFQKEAILCIENNQSVLVSAHTSAGKTVVADSRESDGDLHHEFDYFGTANH